MKRREVFGVGLGAVLIVTNPNPAMAYGPVVLAILRVVFGRAVVSGTVRLGAGSAARSAIGSASLRGGFKSTLELGISVPGILAVSTAVADAATNFEASAIWSLGSNNEYSMTLSGNIPVGPSRIRSYMGFQIVDSATGLVEKEVLKTVFINPGEAFSFEVGLSNFDKAGAKILRPIALVDFKSGELDDRFKFSVSDYRVIMAHPSQIQLNEG